MDTAETRRNVKHIWAPQKGGRLSTRYGYCRIEENLQPNTGAVKTRRNFYQKQGLPKQGGQSPRLPTFAALVSNDTRINKRTVLPELLQTPIMGVSEKSWQSEEGESRRSTGSTVLYDGTDGSVCVI
jgi:hypothetical protein